jgi:N-acylneuraminate cytidylyltransferase
MTVTKNIAIIPARGGSKRIPRKNIKEFLGKPIIAYSIQAALESNLFDEVIVSTEDKEIAEIAKSFGASVPFLRSAENSDDYATFSDVLLEVSHQLKTAGVDFENICLILSTAPFVTSSKLIDSFKIFDTERFDSLYPVLEFSYPIQRSLVRNEKGLIQMAQPEHLRTRSQDLEKHYHDAGQFYWIKQNALEKEKSLMTTNTGMIELSQLEVHDIDTPDDWANAEIKYQILHAKN